MLTDCYAVILAFVQFFRFFFKTKEVMCMGKRPISSSAVTYSLPFSVYARHFFFFSSSEKQRERGGRGV